MSPQLRTDAGRFESLLATPPGLSPLARRRRIRQALSRTPVLAALRAIPAPIADILMRDARLGAVEGEPPDPEDPGMQRRLQRGRRALATAANQNTQQGSNSCLLPAKGRWWPVLVKSVPSSQRESITVVLDHNARRADGLAQSLISLVDSAQTQPRVTVLRTRFGSELEELPEAWVVPLRAAVRLAASDHTTRSLRWACVTGDAELPSADALPFDVRVLFDLAGGQAGRRWERFPHAAALEATERFRQGGFVQLPAEREEDIEGFIARLGG